MKHIWCLDTNTASTAGVTSASGRLNRIYLTDEEAKRVASLKKTGLHTKGILYKIEPGTIQEYERNQLEVKS